MSLPELNITRLNVENVDISHVEMPTFRLTGLTASFIVVFLFTLAISALTQCCVAIHYLKHQRRKHDKVTPQGSSRVSFLCDT